MTKTSRATHVDDLALVLAGDAGAPAVERLSALLMSSDEAFWSLDLRTLAMSISRNMEVAFGHRVADLGHELQDLAAEASEERSRRRLVERSVDEVVWEWDIATNAVSFSGAIGTIFGYGPAEVEPTYAWWEEHVHPDDRGGIRHSLAMHLADDLEEWIGTYRFRRADGTYVWTRDRGYLERGSDKGRRRMVGAMSLVAEPHGPAVTGALGHARLSPRQMEVLRLVRAGYTNKQIAVRLRMGEQSAKDHVSRLLKLLDAPNRAALVAAADDAEIIRDRRAGPGRASDGPPALFAVTRGPEHVLVTASPGVLDLTPGRSPLGKPLRVAYPELAGQGVFELFDVVYRDGKSSRAERLLGRFAREGSPVTVVAEVRLDPITDEHGNVDGVHASGADLSHRERADAAPTAGLSRQMTALEDLPIGAVLTDGSGTITSMNAEARRVLGAAIADGRPAPPRAIEYHLRDAATGKKLGPAETAIARALRGEVISQRDYLLRPPGTDTDVVLRTSAMPVHGPDGVVAVLLTFSELERRPAG